MQTNIEIDDDLLREAMGVTGATTESATVETALRRLIEVERRRRAFADMAGLGWEGDLDSLREGRFTQDGE